MQNSPPATDETGEQNQTEKDDDEMERTIEMRTASDMRTKVYTDYAEWMSQLSFYGGMNRIETESKVFIGNQMIYIIVLKP